MIPSVGTWRSWSFFHFEADEVGRVTGAATIGAEGAPFPLRVEGRRGELGAERGLDGGSGRAGDFGDLDRSPTIGQIIGRFRRVDDPVAGGDLGVASRGEGGEVALANRDGVGQRVVRADDLH